MVKKKYIVKSQKAIDNMTANIINNNYKSSAIDSPREDVTEDITLDEIETSTGGIVTDLQPEDTIYMEKIASGKPSGRVTNVDSIDNFISQKIKIPFSIRKTIAIDDAVTSEIAIDLTEYIYYKKFHIQFPKTRDVADITVSITGLNNLIHPMESITMSGLDNDGETYLPSGKRGTITFTLDSTDYEFPSSVYHFGGFATGSNPAYIFLQIDYTEADSSSSFKYVAENAIYGDENKAECELWSNESTNNDEIKVHKTHTTIILKYDGLLATGTSSFFALSADKWYAVTVNGSGYNISSFYNQALFNKMMPILNPTGFISNENTFQSIGHLYNKASSYTVSLIYINYGQDNILCDFTEIKSMLTSTSTSYWDTPCTEYGVYRVIVKGTYAQKQLSL